MGFAYLVAPRGRRERRQWFGLAGWVPEGLLGQAGRFIPWRTLVEFRPPAEASPGPAPEGAVIGLSASADALRRWEEGKRRRHLVRLVEGLAGQGVRAFGCGEGFGSGAQEAPDPLREAIHDVYGPEGACLVGQWAGPLAGTLAAAELLASTRNWDCERAEVVVVGGETAAGRVAARLLARRFGSLTLAGEAPALSRLAEQILHETGTAVRVSANWGRILSRAALVVLAAPWPTGAAALLRPESVALVAGSEAAAVGDEGTAGSCRATVASGVLFSWPSSQPSAGLPGVIWPGAQAMVAAGLAAVAAVAVGLAERDGAADGGEELRLAGGREPSLGGAETLCRALARCGFRAAALLDKAGAVLL
ncbi:MAG TPA: hypothetical protein GXX28_11285 [Firmicutes bacterium]|nr:hypothetical protein [Bacillota bacterium]